MAQVKDKLESGAIAATTFTVGAQRRAILEAIAFGTFLRDVESSIESDYGLLTASKTDGFGPPSFGSGGDGGGPNRGGRGGGGPFVKSA